MLRLGARRVGLLGIDPELRDRRRRASAVELAVPGQSRQSRRRDRFRCLPFAVSQPCQAAAWLAVSRFRSPPFARPFRLLKRRQFSPFACLLPSGRLLRRRFRCRCARQPPAFAFRLPFLAFSFRCCRSPARFSPLLPLPPSRSPLLPFSLAVSARRRCLSARLLAVTRLPASFRSPLAVSSPFLARRCRSLPLFAGFFARCQRRFRRGCLFRRSPPPFLAFRGSLPAVAAFFRRPLLAAAAAARCRRRPAARCQPLPAVSSPAARRCCQG